MRGWKVVIGVLTAIVVLVVVNTIVTDRDTEPAKADGGRIIDLPGGDLQVSEYMQKTCNSGRKNGGQS